MALGSGSETPAGTLAGECWLAVQADSAATQTAAAAATTLTARMLIRRTALRQGCAAVSAARGRDPFRGSRVPHGMRVPQAPSTGTRVPPPSCPNQSSTLSALPRTLRTPPRPTPPWTSLVSRFPGNRSRPSWSCRRAGTAWPPTPLMSGRVPAARSGSSTRLSVISRSARCDRSAETARRTSGQRLPRPGPSRRHQGSISWSSRAGSPARPACLSR
jgi:hypothetical protein